jgi:hypothetical protein
LTQLLSFGSIDNVLDYTHVYIDSAWCFIQKLHSQQMLEIMILTDSGDRAVDKAQSTRRDIQKVD